MSREIRCIGCGIFLGELSSGSRIRKGVSFRCSVCESRISDKEVADALNKIGNSGGVYNEDIDNNDFLKSFGDIFGGFGK